MGVLYPEDFDNSGGSKQPPAGYIWPPGFYPIYTQHSLNLLAAERYVEEQQRLAERDQWNREHPWSMYGGWRGMLASAVLWIIVGIIVVLFQI
jgi:hypothetical protein